MIKIGSLELGSKPCIAAIIDSFVPIEDIISLKQRGIDLLEMRIDCYREPLEEIVSFLKQVGTTGLPTIGTVRENDTNRLSRIEIFKAIVPYVDCIDMELGSSISDEVLAFCKDKTIIISEHDFNETPSEARLQDMVFRALAQGAHIVKIAVMAETLGDVKRLLNFTDKCDVPIVTIAMGSIGAISRLVAPVFGSLFTYGYLTRPVAPGQLSVSKLLEEFGVYYEGTSGRANEST